jgi:hypothetical protein
MTNTQLARQAIRLWSNPMAPKSTNRHNQRQWLASVIRLGDKWLLANPVGKKSS